MVRQLLDLLRSVLPEWAKAVKRVVLNNHIFDRFEPKLRVESLMLTATEIVEVWNTVDVLMFEGDWPPSDFDPATDPDSELGVWRHFVWDQEFFSKLVDMRPEKLPDVRVFFWVDDSTGDTLVRVLYVVPEAFFIQPGPRQNTVLAHAALRRKHEHDDQV